MTAEPSLQRDLRAPEIEAMVDAREAGCVILVIFDYLREYFGRFSDFWFRSQTSGALIGSRQHHFR